MQSSELELLAKRFGGSRIARLAAQQALLSHETGGDADPAPSSSSNSVCAQQCQQQPEDDEALLLSDRLDGPRHADDWLPRRSPTVAQRDVSPPVNSELFGVSQPAVSVTPVEQLVGKPSDGSSATGASSDCTPPAPPLHSFCDASEEDTVLTGSPVCSPGSSRRSSAAQEVEAAEAAGTNRASSTAASACLPSPSPVETITQPALAVPQPPAEATASSAQAEASVRQELAPPRARTSRPAALAHSAPLPCAPGNEAIRQRQWSFADIPQGFASIPCGGTTGKAGAATSAGLAVRAGSAAGACSSAKAPRPAFYTRAASPPPRPLGIVPPRAKSATGGGGEGAAIAPAESRLERLARLAQPKHARTRHHLQRQSVEQRHQHALPAATPALGTAASWAKAEVPSNGGKKGQLDTGTALQAAVPAAGSIAAWRPAASSGTHMGLPHQRAAPQQQARRSSCGSGAHGDKLEAAKGRARWPQHLGEAMDAAEQQTATGAYSEERFQQHMAQLSARLAARQAKRQLEADTAAAGVDELVEQVQQLGAGAAAAAARATCTAAEHGDVASYAGDGAEADTVAAASQECGWSNQTGGVADEQALPTPAGAPVCSPVEKPLGQLRENVEPAGSPAVKLQSCHERLLRRPLTAPQQQPWLAAPGGPERRRPASGSPAKIKHLMQVKRELDRAVAELGSQPHRFRASPLPLSTMEPRYHREVQQQQQRRQGALELRRGQLLAGQQPFGMEGREAERRARRLLVHGCDSWVQPDGGCTPHAFHAQPVPVATTEARYALLVAEMQLQGRTVRGRQLASQPHRPATAAALHHMPLERRCIRPLAASCNGLDHAALRAAALDAALEADLEERGRQGCLQLERA
ncbi:hypothetical protein ABPG77_002238 [Micractinium sp. CCAP 211/92]